MRRGVVKSRHGVLHIRSGLSNLMAGVGSIGRRRHRNDRQPGISASGGAWPGAPSDDPETVDLLGRFSVPRLAGLGRFRGGVAGAKKGTFKAFRLLWNLICGIPLQVPWFTYDGVHNDHHKRDLYGTAHDGEYNPFGIQKPAGMIGYVLLSFILPLFFAGRFLVLAPLSYISGPVRKFAWARASSLTIDLGYIRPENALRGVENWKAQEFGAFLFSFAAVACTVKSSHND